MTRLSVNINKVALLRNARGGGVPDLVRVARDCESFGAQGITVHPRPDERHVRRADVAPLRAAVARVGGRVETEASGNVTLDSLGAIAATGVDFISSGALTHSVTALDVSLKVGLDA